MTPAQRPHSIIAPRSPKKTKTAKVRIKSKGKREKGKEMIIDNVTSKGSDMMKL